MEHRNNMVVSIIERNNAKLNERCRMHFHLHFFLYFHWWQKHLSQFTFFFFFSLGKVAQARSHTFIWSIFVGTLWKFLASNLFQNKSFLSLLYWPSSLELLSLIFWKEKIVNWCYLNINTKEKILHFKIDVSDTSKKLSA